MNGVRYTVAGVVVRFFPDRRSALNICNARTNLFDQQHRALATVGPQFSGHYVVQNIVTKDLFDVSGAIPEAAARVIIEDGLKEK